MPQVRRAPVQDLKTQSPESHSSFEVRSDRQVRGSRYVRLLQGLGPRFSFGGVELLDCDVDQAADALASAALARQGVGVHMCNAYTVTIAMSEPGYRDALNHNALNLPDGTPLAWFFRMVTGTKARGPVRGPSLMKALLRKPDLTHFLLGGSEQVLEDLQKAIVNDHDSAAVVGALAPPFRDPTADDVLAYAAAINESGAHLVWVGLGTPRQDQLIAALTDHVDAVLVGVGAAFDFLSGAKQEAPAFLHGTGLEWVHRLFSEPQRLWRRYLVCNIVFLGHAAREAAAQRRSASF